MQIRTSNIWVSSFVVFAATAAWATAPVTSATDAAKPVDHDHAAMAKAAPASKEFEALKKLAGRWEGKSMMHGEEVPVTIVYSVTSGGTAILETMFPGTPHEMISVYTVNGKTVDLTHYCGAGNQPKLALKASDPKSVSFEMTGTEGLHSAKEMHMHAMSLSFVDPNHIKELWTSFDNGVKKDDKVFDLTRKGT